MIAFVLFAIAIVSVTATNKANEAAIGPCISGKCPQGYECADEVCVKMQAAGEAGVQKVDSKDSAQS